MGFCSVQRPSAISMRLSRSIFIVHGVRQPVFSNLESLESLESNVELLGSIKFGKVRHHNFRIFERLNLGVRCLSWRHRTCLAAILLVALCHCALTVAEFAQTVFVLESGRCQPLAPSTLGYCWVKGAKLRKACLGCQWCLVQCPILIATTYRWWLLELIISPVRLSALVVSFPARLGLSWDEWWMM